MLCTEQQVFFLDISYDGYHNVMLQPKHFSDDIIEINRGVDCA